MPNIQAFDPSYLQGNANMYPGRVGVPNQPPSGIRQPPGIGYIPGTPPNHPPGGLGPPPGMGFHPNMRNPIHPPGGLGPPPGMGYPSNMGQHPPSNGPPPGMGYPPNMGPPPGMAFPPGHPNNSNGAPPNFNEQPKIKLPPPPKGLPPSPRGLRPPPPPGKPSKVPEPSPSTPMQEKQAQYDQSENNRALYGKEELEAQSKFSSLPTQEMYRPNTMEQPPATVVENPSRKRKYASTMVPASVRVKRAKTDAHSLPVKPTAPEPKSDPLAPTYDIDEFMADISNSLN
eukprot:TRINITY_DN7814_c0_g1_i2.p1 TRINITY_DN7814_c0_g1~~TRINITY_DN7814_c0_g1_i2.p1  ORF type:complete len:286 (+),score=84.47 TRINITY_DN7814_c0_g1_i2:570-1427(+)